MRDGWTGSTLGELASTVSPSGTVPGFRYVGLEHFDSGIPTIVRWGSTDDVSSATTVFRRGDVLFSKLRPYLRKVAVSGFEGRCTSEALVYRPRVMNIDAGYLGLVLQSDAAIGHAQASSAGSRMPRTSAKLMSSLKVPVPPLAEQRRIVDLLAAVDTARAAANELADGLEFMWWSLAKKLAEDALGLPTTRLEDLADIHGGLTKNKKDADRDDAVEVPYLRVANVHRRRLVLHDVASIIAARPRVEAALLEPGDILMNEGGDRDKLGRGAIWRGEVAGCTHQNHVFRVRVTHPGFVPEFVSAWANSFGRKWFEVHGAQTTGIASISKTTLSKFPVPTLPLEEQQRWATLLDGVTEQEWEVRAQLERLGRLRSNLLTALLSGEHEIPDSYDELLAG